MVTCTAPKRRSAPEPASTLDGIALDGPGLTGAGALIHAFRPTLHPALADQVEAWLDANRERFPFLIRFVREAELRGTGGTARDQAQRGLVGDLVDRAFAGSAARLVMQALAGRETSPEEIAAIRDLLDRLEEEGE